MGPPPRWLSPPSAAEPWLPAEPDEAAGIDADDLDAGASRVPAAREFGPGARPLTWKEHLGAVRHALEAQAPEPAPAWPAGREILYVVEADDGVHEAGLAFELYVRDPRKRGGFTQPRRLGVRAAVVDALPDPADRRIEYLVGRD